MELQLWALIFLGLVGTSVNLWASAARLLSQWDTAELPGHVWNIEHGIFWGRWTKSTSFSCWTRNAFGCSSLFMGICALCDFSSLRPYFCALVNLTTIGQIRVVPEMLYLQHYKSLFPDWSTSGNRINTSPILNFMFFLDFIFCYIFFSNIYFQYLKY